jgi:transglutaminase-like putative cysteine protease
MSVGIPARQVYTPRWEHSDDNPYNVVVSPRGVVRLGCADELSKKILFVALCRTAGIPARIEEVERKLQYWDKSLEP